MVEFAGMIFVLPTGWFVITADLPSGSPPTRARPDGTGVIQFSVAHYAAGSAPHIDLSSLEKLFDDFCCRQGLQVDKRNVVGARRMVVSGIHSTSAELTAIWYVSDGRNLALVSYCANAPTGSVDEELVDAMTLVQSASFAQRA